MVYPSFLSEAASSSSQICFPLFLLEAEVTFLISDMGLALGHWVEAGSRSFKDKLSLSSNLRK
jgi:hypothetical protein